MSKIEKALIKLGYPILGNLSAQVQERLEDKLKLENYNGISASNISILTNLPVYGMVLYEFGKNAYNLYASGQTDMGIYDGLTLITLIFSLSETFFRFHKILGEDTQTTSVDVLKQKYRKIGREYNFSGEGFEPFDSLYLRKITVPQPTGSVIGKLFSLPIEYLIRYKERKKGIKKGSRHGKTFLQDNRNTYEV